MELEIELTENLIAPSLTTQPNGRIRLTFHWRDEIRRVLELVTHPQRSAVEDGFIELWSCDESFRIFEQDKQLFLFVRNSAVSRIEYRAR